MAFLSPASLTGSGELRILDHAAAMRTWNWILTRQGLSDSRRLATAWQVAEAALGLHAARLPSPYAIVAARTSAADVPASLFTDQVRASLITIRCMRKTLHTLPLPLAAAAHTATLRFRDRDARRAVLNAGYTTAAIDGVIDQLRAVLQENPLPPRAIEARLAARGTDIHAGRLAVKVAWERGTITYINATSTWNHEARTFALTAAAYPALDVSHTREQAVTQLVTAYFDRYGPATLRDAAWWSGLPATQIAAALQACGRPVTSVATPWSDQPCLMFADQAAHSTDNAGSTGVQFLAHEDTALKAYFQTRDRYLGGLAQQRAFNQIGEVLPCILVDGIVAGTWSWNARTASVDADLIPGRCPSSIRRQVSVRAAALTDTLRTGWAPRRPSQRPPVVRRPAAQVSTRIAPPLTRPTASVADSAPPCLRGDDHMEPLSRGASLPGIQDYVARMEAERGLDAQDLPSQCLKLGEEVGELYRAVRRLQGHPQDPDGRIADVGDEAADALILLMSIANRCGINLEDAFRAKESRNESRIWV